MNISLKSGTNKLHGSAYWGKQTPSMNANTWFANLNGQPRGDFNYYRVGGVLNGPVVHAQDVQRQEPNVLPLLVRENQHRTGATLVQRQPDGSYRRPAGRRLLRAAPAGRQLSDLRPVHSRCRRPMDGSPTFRSPGTSSRRRRSARLRRKSSATIRCPESAGTSRRRQ